MGNFNVMPFNLDTDRKVLSMSIDLTSCEIKPGGHYVPIKHNYS